MGWARNRLLTTPFPVSGRCAALNAGAALRTGNDWVHALGYHAVAPRALVDTPLIVKALGIG